MSSTWKYIKRTLDDASTIRGDVYAFETPSKRKQPFVTFFLTELEPEFTIDKASPIDLETWVFISSDNKVGDAIINADAIRTLIDHTSGTADNVTIKQALMLGRSIPIVEEDAQGDKIFQVIDEYQFRV